MIRSHEAINKYLCVYVAKVLNYGEIVKDNGFLHNYAEGFLEDFFLEINEILEIEI